MNYTIVITQNGITIFSGYFVVDHSVIIECYENGNPNNILAPIGSYGENNNMFGSVTNPFNDNGVNLTTMSYYAGNYGENSSDKTYNLYSFSEKNGFIANFNGVYHFTISTGSVPVPIQPILPEQPVPQPVQPVQPVRSGMYYKLRMEITLDDSTVFSGFFVINNHVHPNIIGFYEDGNPKNILAPPGSNGNDNVFRSLTHPFSEKGVTIKTMSYYTITDRNDPLPNDNGTYTLLSFSNHTGFISGIAYRYTITLDNGPIPLHPIEPIVQPITLMASTALMAPTIALTAPIAPYQPYQKSRFCYHYKPPGIIEPCCKPVVCATNEYIASLASIPAVVNNSTRTIESSLLQATVKRQQQEIQTQTINRTVQDTIVNAAAINESIRNQLVNIRNERYAPYQPYVYPVVPPSVIELQMRTANVGVPHTFNTIANCKGNQFVTT